MVFGPVSLVLPSWVRLSSSSELGTDGGEARSESLVMTDDPDPFDI